MDRCYFAKEAPKIEVRGELLFIVCDVADCEVAVTPHVLQSFIARADRALAEMRSAEIIAFPDKPPARHG